MFIRDGKFVQLQHHIAFCFPVTALWTNKFHDCARQEVGTARIPMFQAGALLLTVCNNKIVRVAISCANAVCPCRCINIVRKRSYPEPLRHAILSSRAVIPEQCNSAIGVMVFVFVTTTAFCPQQQHHHWVAVHVLSTALAVALLVSDGSALQLCASHNQPYVVIQNSSQRTHSSQYKGNKTFQ